VLSRYPVLNIQTHAHLWSSKRKSYLFSRDCLVVDVELPGSVTLTLFINHFKSMIDREHPDNGRRNTRAKREIQSRKVKDIVKARFGSDAGKHPFIVMGDFNDYMQEDTQGKPGIADLVEWDQVTNVVDRLHESDRWTHYFKGRKKSVPAAYRQLDYLLLSKSLSKSNPQPPYIERRGLPKRAKKYSGERFQGVGDNKPKASDHCPLVMELKF